MKYLAERLLFYSLKNSCHRHPLTISISHPYTVTEDMVDFQIGEGLVGCTIESFGLEVEYKHEVYGMDIVQAINIASNLEPFLERLQKKYDLYWLSGEPYFDELSDLT